MLRYRTIDSFQFGFSLNLTESQLRPLTSLLHDLESTEMAALGGRTAVTPARLDGIGAVVIKHYRRGGMLRHFTKRRYLKLGKTRAQREFELLDAVAKFGINVPQPIAFVYQGAAFYRAWLITREIQRPVSLAGLSLQDEEKSGRVMESVIKQISALIQHQVLHVDLHPGNVIVDPDGKVYLLDFDKGKVYHGDRQKLKNRYLTRWQRAVNKHGLPEFLTEMMQTGLS